MGADASPTHNVATSLRGMGIQLGQAHVMGRMGVLGQGHDGQGSTPQLAAIQLGNHQPRTRRRRHQPHHHLTSSRLCPTLWINCDPLPASTHVPVVRCESMFVFRLTPWIVGFNSMLGILPNQARRMQLKSCGPHPHAAHVG